jgi:IPT/TIG domain-containing protein
MALRSRTRLQLRRTVVAAALGALFVPAVADAKTKTPVITKVTPKFASVGTKITITGKNFRRGKAKNSVLFRRDKGKALFVKADVSTTKKLTVIVPKTLEKYMLVKGASPVPTRFKLRVLAAKLTKAYTSSKLSPVIGPEKPAGGSGGGVPTAPDGDCDGDGAKNSVDADDDNDLLADSLEISLSLDPCSGDTDGDGVEDGFEYQSAVDLNNDDYQSPNSVVPYPAKTPYPNPLFKDADTDYDGDSLSLSMEYKLWKYTYEVNHTSARTLSPLSYSDGAQYSLSTLEAGVGRRIPSTLAADYLPPQTFRAWANASFYGTPQLFPANGPRVQVPVDLFDMDRNGTVTTAELYYWGGSGYVSDDERDEDADGLTNYDENTGRMSAGWWTACYPPEGTYPIAYAGTKAFDADSDGDGILDGADDQDFDDVPNVMELSRSLAGHWARNGSCGRAGVYDAAAPSETYVNPFNPCLPDMYSRTCTLHPNMAASYAPFVENFKPVISN